MRGIRFSLLAILLLAFAISVMPGCDCNEPDDEGEVRANVAPTIEIVMPPPEAPNPEKLNNLSYDLQISWRANDLDGRVLGYFYRWIHTQVDPMGDLPDSTTIWYWTEQNQLTAELDVQREHTFEVIAVDNRASWQGYEKYWDQAPEGATGIKYSEVDQEIFYDVDDDDIYDKGEDPCLEYYAFLLDDPTESAPTPTQGLTPGIDTPDQYNLSPVEDYLDIMNKDGLVLPPWTIDGAISEEAVFSDAEVQSSQPSTSLEDYPPEVIFVPKDGEGEGENYVPGFEEQRWVGQDITLKMVDLDQNGNPEGTPTQFTWAIADVSFLDTLRLYSLMDSNGNYIPNPADSEIDDLQGFTVRNQIETPIPDQGDEKVIDILSDPSDPRVLQSWVNWIDIEEYFNEHKESAEAELDLENFTFTIDDASIFPKLDPTIEKKYALFVRSRDNAYQEEGNLTPQYEEGVYPEFWAGLDFNCKKLNVVTATYEKSAILLDDYVGPPNNDKIFFQTKLEEVLGADYNMDEDIVQLSDSRALEATDIAAYKCAIFISNGFGSSNQMVRPQQQQLIQEYIRAGGRLWVDTKQIGDRFNFSPTNPPPDFRKIPDGSGDTDAHFLYEVFHIQGIAIGNVEALPPGTFGKNLNSPINYPQLTEPMGIPKNFIHIIQPRSDSEVSYRFVDDAGEKHAVGLRYKDENETVKLILDSFPLNNFNQEDAKNYTQTVMEEFEVIQ